jgi:hypothetical protein
MAGHGISEAVAAFLRREILNGADPSELLRDPRGYVERNQLVVTEDILSRINGLDFAPFALEWDSIDQEAFGLFDHALKDGRFVAHVTVEPSLVAKRLGLDLSPDAEERIKGYGISSLLDPAFDPANHPSFRRDDPDGFDPINASVPGYLPVPSVWPPPPPEDDNPCWPYPPPTRDPPDPFPFTPFPVPEAPFGGDPPIPVPRPEPDNPYVWPWPLPQNPPFPVPEPPRPRPEPDNPYAGGLVATIAITTAVIAITIASSDQVGAPPIVDLSGLEKF